MRLALLFYIMVLLGRLSLKSRFTTDERLSCFGVLQDHPKSGPKQSQSHQITQSKHVDVLWMPVLILVSNRAFQCSNRICCQDRHAQAQHWLRHAQPQLMYAQHEPQTLMRTRQGGQPPLALNGLGSLANAEYALSEP